MTVVYELDLVKQRIHTRCIGAVTLDDVRRHFADLASDPTCPERLDVLLDLSQITSLPSSGQLAAVTDEIARIRSRVEFRSCAVVAADDAMFGMARMFEVFAEQHFAAIRVFRTLDAGTNWLNAGDTRR